MQVYRGMDIGTAKPTPSERTAVPHHLLDLVDPSEPFTLRQHQQAAQAAVADIERRGNRPLLVGGTGLYLRSIVDDLEIPGRYPAARASLEANPDTAALHAQLARRDPTAASRIEPANRRRIIRALEVCLGSGRTFSSFGHGLDTYPATDWDMVALAVDPDILAVRIEARYREQLANGFLEEVRALAELDPPIGRTAAQALGYRQFLDQVSGATDFDAALDAAVAATRRFARRQRSWFRRDPRLTWMDATDPDSRSDLVAELVARWQIDPQRVPSDVGD